MVLAIAGCKGRTSPPAPEVPAGADRLGTDRAPGVESVFGFALPRTAHVERQFATTAYARMTMDSDTFLRFLRHVGEPFKEPSDTRRTIVISPFRLRANHDEYRLEWQQLPGEQSWTLKLDWVDGERRAGPPK